MKEPNMKITEYAPGYSINEYSPCFTEVTIINYYFSEGKDLLSAGVISKGAHGVEPPLLKLLITLGGLAPLKILALALLFKVY